MRCDVRCLIRRAPESTAEPDEHPAANLFAFPLDQEKPFPAARLLQMKALATLKDTEATLVALEAAAAAGFTDTVMIVREPLLQSLSGDPRFQSALDSMERTKGSRPFEQPHTVLTDSGIGSVPTARLVSQLRSNKATGSAWSFDFSLEDVDKHSRALRIIAENP